MSTLYFEMRDVGPTPSKSSLQRGILRVSLNTFLQSQLPSMRVIGVDDPDRRKWALVAFYKYFVGELVAVYGDSAAALTQLLAQLVTSIHV